MKTVKVRSVGVQVNGISYFKNDRFQVSDNEYEEIKDYVDILEDNKKVEEEKRVVTIEVKNEKLDLKEVEEYLYDCLERFGKRPEGEQNDNTNTDNKDEELELLKNKAKELGINVSNNMKKETIIKKIQEKEKSNENNKNE